jgi:hypothetical protein
MAASGGGSGAAAIGAALVTGGVLGYLYGTGTVTTVTADTRLEAKPTTSRPGRHDTYTISVPKFSTIMPPGGEGVKNIQKVSVAVCVSKGGAAPEIVGYLLPSMVSLASPWWSSQPTSFLYRCPTEAASAFKATFSVPRGTAVEISFVGLHAESAESHAKFGSKGSGPTVLSAAWSLARTYGTAFPKVAVAVKLVEIFKGIVHAEDTYGTSPVVNVTGGADGECPLAGASGGAFVFALKVFFSVQVK